MSAKTKPLTLARVLHRCHIFNSDVGMEQCQDQSRIVLKNMEYCCAKSCTASWRFCIACLRQGYKSRDNLVVKPEKGLCDFHLMHGPNTKRESSIPTLALNADRPAVLKKENNHHSDRASERDVVQQVLFESRSVVEAARKLDCSPQGLKVRCKVLDLQIELEALT